MKSMFMWVENKFWNVTIPLMSNSSIVHKTVLLIFRVDKFYKSLNLFYQILFLMAIGWLVGCFLGFFVIGGLF